MRTVEEQRRLQAQRDHDYLRGQVSYLNREVDALRAKVAFLEATLLILMTEVEGLNAAK